MKNFIISIFMIVSLTAFGQKNKKSNIETIQLQPIIEQINNSLAKAYVNPNVKASIKSASISLKTAYDSEGGGGFKFFVKGSKEWSSEKASTFTYNFEVVPPKQETNPKDVGFVNLEKNLTDGIIDACTEWDKIKSIRGLDKKDFGITLSFTATRTTNGGVEFELWGVGFDVKGKKSNAITHTITLTFK